MAEPVKLRLKHPVMLGSQAIEELTFRRGRCEDLKGISLDGISVDGLMTIAGRLCGQTQAVIGKLDEEDCGPVMEIAATFFRRCLSTGETS